VLRQSRFRNATCWIRTPQRVICETPKDVQTPSLSLSLSLDGPPSS
jgi:hypothetical protein